MLLWKWLADESADRCFTCTDRDAKTVAARAESEGESFFTISLPNFGKAFERSLELGSVSPASFPGFRFRRGLPVFLRGFLERIFDHNSGVILDLPCVDSIRAVRQLSGLYGKMLGECSDARNQAAIQGFLECEKELKSLESGFSDPSFYSDFRRISTLLFGDMFSELDRKIWANEHLVPKHGPGATADGLAGNRKFYQSEWPLRLEEYFPFLEYALPNSRYWRYGEFVKFLEPGEERPARVTLVPKTPKTPRVISIEPTCMQYTQQALSGEFVKAIEGSYLSHFIGFTDASTNRKMAQKGSVSKSLATLDLSEASDRVSNQHVRALLSSWPHLLGAVQACRSRKADVTGTAVTLSKFASMGSALTFPVEAMVFLVIAFIGIEKELTQPLNRRTLFGYRGRVRVYGDDIIVPTDMVSSVIAYLESFGLKVNSNKSFWNGNFRESCGGDYFAGDDVTIVRARRPMPSSRRQVQEVISLVSLRNQLYHAGYWRTVDKLDGRLSDLLGGHFPTVSCDSPVLGRHTYLAPEGLSSCEHLHKPLVRGYVVKSVIPKSKLNGQRALLKCFLSQSDEPIADELHLERAGRPRAVNIKLRRGPF
jgi:hypothetical protein